jgi:glycerol uptake facilitator-like aquaporin
LGRLLFYFLAAAIGVAAAAFALPAAATEQDQQDDDPTQIAATEAVITKVTHKTYLQRFLMRFITAHPML